MKNLLIYGFLFLSFYCSSENRATKDSRVYARVGNNTLTDENLVLFNTEKPFSNDALQRSIENWIDQSLILSEAKKEGFEKDVVLIKKKELYYNQLIISSFIEKHMSSHINILKDDVRLYYKQNKSSFIRNQDEAQIEQYIMESEKEARKLVRSFSSRKVVDMGLFSIRSTYQDIIKKGTFSKEKRSPKSVFFEMNRNTLDFDGTLNDNLEKLYAELDEKFSRDLAEIVRSGNISEDGLVSLLVMVSSLKWRLPINDKLFDEKDNHYTYDSNHHMTNGVDYSKQ